MFLFTKSVFKNVSSEALRSNSFSLGRQFKYWTIIICTHEVSK